MARPTNVAVNALDRITSKAAGEIFIGTFVQRSADGTCVYCVDGAEPNHLGVADSSPVEQTVLHKYSQYDPVSIISAGRVNVWTYEADITAGMYLLVADDFGLCKDDGAKSTNLTVAKATKDAASTDETTGGLAATAATKSLTVTSTTGFAAGDAVLLDSGTDSSSEIAIIDAISSATELTVKENLAYTYSGKDMHLLVQTEAIIIQ